MAASPTSEHNELGLGKIGQLELQVTSLNEEVCAEAASGHKFLRTCGQYQKLLGAMMDLQKEYRDQNDFQKEMQLYNAQQELFSRYDDQREFVPWEIYKGGCCKHYEKKEEALKYLENAFRLSLALSKDRGNTLLEFDDLRKTRPVWSMLWMPLCGKDLCLLYMDMDRKDDAIQVASTCYTHVRNRVTELPPVGPGFRPALSAWLHWAEICGRMYEEGGQTYMARMVYDMTIQDLKRFHWDSPTTEMHSRERDLFSGMFKRKLERLGPDSDEEGSDEEEPPTAAERRLQLAFLKPALDPNDPIECTTSFCDIAKAPPYRALSYAWGNSRKVISYTREDGSPYADEEASGAAEIVEETILVDGQDLRIRQTLFHALQRLRQSDSEAVIWVDALCTRPEEVNKRAAWALRMRDIYKNAHEVVVWLGQGDEDTQRGMAFLDKFWDERPKYARGGLGEFLFGSNTTVPWEGICKILQFEWWSRIWTIEEFIVAKELTIWCGAQAVPWRNLLELTTFVDLTSRSHRLLTEELASLQPTIDLVKERHEYISLRDEYQIDSGFPLERLWQMTKRHQAHDPRDKIFALLGLLNQPSAKHAPKSNYDFCPCAVYSDMIVFRSLGDQEALKDNALAMSRYVGVWALLGMEQGTEEALKHIYTWDSQKIQQKCDGEECGRRLSCFLNKVPSFPSNWSIHRILDFMKKMHDSYIEMKRDEITMDLIIQKINDTELDGNSSET